MTWCLDRVAEGDLQLSDVIWTDESSIQLGSHLKITYQKKGHPVHLAGRPKHPPKIHVWGGISSRSANPIVMFTGTFIATRYTRILDAALVLFIQQRYPNGHRFQQDNNPKHKIRWAQAYFELEQIPVGDRSFRDIWRRCVPWIRFMTPRTDVCNKCELH